MLRALPWAACASAASSSRARLRACAQLLEFAQVVAQKIVTESPCERWSSRSRSWFSRRAVRSFSIKV